MVEAWRVIAGYENYEVSDHGRVRNTVTGTIRATCANNSGGYPRLLLRRKPHYVHTLVLEAFVGPRPDGMEACHRDGNPLNNRASNLRWDTHRANVWDAIRHGTMQPVQQMRTVESRPDFSETCPRSGQMERMV